MDVLITLAVTLYSVVIVTFVANMIQLVKETKRLREEGKTPLVGRNITTVVVAAWGEVLTVVILIYLTSLFTTEPNFIVAALVFILAYLLRNVAAYFMGWAVWAIFVKIERKKMKDEIEDDQQGAL